MKISTIEPWGEDEEWIANKDKEIKPENKELID